MTIDGIRLDHVALAFERRQDAWPRYGGDLPGRWLGGGTAIGFANYQLEYAGGMRVEILEPANIDKNDFLRRFLDHTGPGTHHLTFKVPDIHAAIEQVERAGYHPVGVNVAFPFWKEMFIHPKEGPGIVVQIAQSSGDHPDMPLPDGFPAPRTPTIAALQRVVHAVDLDAGRRVFRDLLGGEPDGADLVWPGGGRLQLVPDRSLLEFATDDPAGVPGAVRDAEGPGWEVPPEHNFGTRLRLLQTS